VTYQNTSSNPSLLTRTVEFEINDGNTNSNVVSRDITTNPVNNAPVVFGIEALPTNYIENSAPIPVTSLIGISDPDDIQIQSATVTISSNYAPAEDTLLFNNQSGITGVFDISTATLNLNGSATLANYQQALQSVRYVNSSDNPNTLQRTVEFTINDNFTASNTISREISVIPVNDAPMLDNTELTALQFPENSAPLQITSTINIDDADDTLLESAQVRIGSNFSAGEDFLSFADQNGIIGNYNPLTGVLQLNGTASVVDYEAALRSVAFEHVSDNAVLLILQPVSCH